MHPEPSPSTLRLSPSDSLRVLRALIAVQPACDRERTCVVLSGIAIRYCPAWKPDGAPDGDFTTPALIIAATDGKLLAEEVVPLIDNLPAKLQALEAMLPFDSYSSKAFPTFNLPAWRQSVKDATAKKQAGPVSIVFHKRPDGKVDFRTEQGGAIGADTLAVDGTFPPYDQVLRPAAKPPALDADGRPVASVGPARIGLNGAYLAALSDIFDLPANPCHRGAVLTFDMQGKGVIIRKLDDHRQRTALLMPVSMP